MMAEVNDAHRVLHFFNGHVVHQHHLGSRPYVDFLESRKRLGDVLDAAIELNLGRGQHAAMRVDAADTAKLIALEQQFFLELYFIVSTQLRAHVDGGGGREVRRAEFEGQLVIGTRPTLLVESAFSKNEVVIVKVELRGVVEQHLANLAVARMLVVIHFDMKFLESLSDCIPEFEEAFFAGEPIGLKQNLILAVMNYITCQMLGFFMLAYVLVHRLPHNSMFAARSNAMVIRRRSR